MKVIKLLVKLLVESKYMFMFEPSNDEFLKGLLNLDFKMTLINSPLKEEFDPYKLLANCFLCKVSA